jgi:hypothetical protein
MTYIQSPLNASMSDEAHEHPSLVSCPWTVVCLPTDLDALSQGLLSKPSRVAVHILSAYAKIRLCIHSAMIGTAS